MSIFGCDRSHLWADPVPLVGGIEGALPWQRWVRRAESVLTHRRSSIWNSSEAGPFNPLLESWVHLRIHFANNWSIDGVHQHPVQPENILVANARELCLASHHWLRCVAELGGQIGQKEQVCETNLRYTAVVVVPPRAPAIRPREKALQKSQLKESYVDQEPGLEQNG